MFESSREGTSRKEEIRGGMIVESVCWRRRNGMGSRGHGEGLNPGKEKGHQRLDKGGSSGR